MDQTRDLSGQQFYRLTQLYDAPAFVKNASVEDLCGPTDLPPEVYADPVHRIYPCHTAAATWASTAFFMNKKGSVPTKQVDFIQDRLQHYAKYHGITNAHKSLLNKCAETEKVPEEVLIDDDYALIVKSGEETKRLYPLRNSKEVVKAADYLHEHRTKIPYNHRREFADKVLVKAAQYGANLGKLQDYIERQAGYGSCAASTAVEFLKDRVKAAQNGPEAGRTELQTTMLKLAETIEQHPSKMRTPGTMCKIAQAVDEYDWATGLRHQYGEKFRPVEDVMFELTREKMASVVNGHCSTITGNIYKVAELEGIKLKDVQQHMGDEFADTVRLGSRVDSEKMAEVIPALDRDLAGVFDQMMLALGKYPIAKEASAPVGLSQEYFMKLASDYKQSYKQ